MNQNVSLLRTVAAYTTDALNTVIIYRNETLKATPVTVGSTPNLYGYNCYNPNTVDVFLKFFNYPITPPVGAVPVTYLVHVAAGQSVVLTGADLLFRFDIKLWMAVTTGPLATDFTAPANGLIVQIFYK
jgi:hypothetical protein